MKKRGIISATAIVLGGALLSGFLGGTPASDAATTTQYTIGMSPIATLDPAINNPNVLLDEGTVLEGLYGFGPQYQLEPKVASSYSVSDGGKVWTFYLRKNARWSNGAPVTANDFYYAWMRVASSQIPDGLIWASVMNYVENAWAYRAGQVPASKVGVKVINPYAIQVTLTNPYDILPMLALSGSMPLYQPDVQKHEGNWYLPQYFVGNGPYKVKSFVSNGEIQLVRNPYYVGHAGEVNVGNIQEINVIPAPSVPVEDFLNHSLDIATIGNTGDYEYVLEHPALKAQLHESPNAAVIGLEWDHAVASSPLDNLKVRQAIAMAIDRAPIVKNVLNGMGEVATAMGPAVLGAPQFEHALPFNVAKARQLLAQAGYPGGKGIPTLALYTQPQATNAQMVSVAEALQEEFKTELGINFQIDPLPNTLWSNIVYNGLNQGVNPGYVISWGSTMAPSPASLTVQGNQPVGDPGVLGGPALRNYASAWYFDTYDARDVKALGNPANASAGLTLSQWQPIENAVKRDSAWLSAYNAKQPAWYQTMMAPQPGQSSLDLFNGLLAQWRRANTPAAKHSAWVSAWKLVGSYSLGNGQAQVGLNGEVYLLQHESSVLNALTMETDHLGIATSLSAAQGLAAQIDNTIMQQGYEEPLYIPDTDYLVSSNLSGAVGNPYFWNAFEDLQYVTAQ